VSRRHFLVSKNLADGLFREGQRLFEQQRFSDAAKSWGLAALLQHAASHAFLSDMLVKDEKRALEMGATGAAMGSAHSKGALGRRLVFGEGVADTAKGLALGSESGAFALGGCFGKFVIRTGYDAGLGVAQDQAEAVRLYRLAAAQGHAAAQRGSRQGLPEFDASEFCAGKYTRLIEGDDAKCLGLENKIEAVFFHGGVTVYNVMFNPIDNYWVYEVQYTFCYEDVDNSR
jgi:hypothetical protein